MNRRNALKTLAGAGATVLLPPWGGTEATAHALQTSDIWPTQKPKNLSYKTSFARWCLGGWIWINSVERRSNWA